MAVAKVKYEFTDNTANVKAELDAAVVAWLYKWSAEIASHAKDNCKLDDDAGIQLRKSYDFAVDESKRVGFVGSPLESSFWEEFGTGHYADQSKNGGRPGRSDWWVYYRNNPNPRSDTPHYTSQAEAEAVAKRLRAQGKDAVATRGREPNYTLEKAFAAKKSKAIDDLKKRL